MPAASTVWRRIAATIALFLSLGGAASADPPAPHPDSSPGDARLLGKEEPTQGAAVPILSPPPDLGALVGKPIRRIDIATVGEKWASSPTVKRVAVGDLLTPEGARLALRELTDSGAFARGTIEALPEGDGVLLRIRVLPRRLIATVQMNGGVLDTGDTLETAGVSDGGEITAPRVPEIATSIRDYYARHGFTSAAVTVDTSDTDDKTRVVVSIEIKPGAPRTVSQRIFVIDPKADREVGDLKLEYKLGRGARIDESALDQADRDFTEVLHQHAFYRADVHHDLEHRGRYSYLYVYIDAGPRLLPLFEGNRSFDKADLEQALELDKPTEGKPAELTARLEHFYVVRGFLDVEIEAVERGAPDDAVHYLAFSIRENPRARVTRRVFPCLPTTWPSGQTAYGPDKMGEEIESFLDEDLPGSDVLSAIDPRGVDAIFGPTTGGGGRAVPLALDPSSTYAPETYDRALKHLRDLFHSEGYLNVIVGPISVVRATCSAKSPPGRCIPEPMPEAVLARCAEDRLGLPLPEPPVPDALMCKPDPKHGITCSPELTVRIPIHLGPRTTLYDIAFEGNHSFSEARLAEVAELKLGGPLSNADLETARLKILDAYKNLGFAYAEVRTQVEPSPDRTRARARFFVSERDLVFVSGFVVKGATRTNENLILGRVALHTGSPYYQSIVRVSEERIATLGTFSSVSIGLEDPEIPQKQKRVVITVAEQLPQYLDPRVGFSTGEGVRFAFEYGHRNIAGEAVSLTLRVQLSYLFDFMILDPQVKTNLGPLPVSQRLERRNSATLNFPEIGLGPLVSLTLEGLDVRDNQRDFGLTRQAFLPTLLFRPSRALRTSLGASAELNDVQIFNADSVNDAIIANPNLATLLRVPDGRTFAVAQRVSATYDRRDSPFAATKGTLFAGAVEHVNAFPADAGDPLTTIRSHFLRFTSKIAGYVRLTKKGTSLAMSISGGYNLQLNSASHTYPDRLFFLGGVDSIRGFLADTVVPEDIAQRILHPPAGQKVLTIDQVGIRGGDVMLNPRIELRVPVNDTFAIGLFLDTGNLWVEPSAINLLALHYAAGAGLRIGTPIGPIALDYGINLDGPERKTALDEDFGAFHFSIGLF